MHRPEERMEHLVLIGENVFSKSGYFPCFGRCELLYTVSNPSSAAGFLWYDATPRD